MSSLIRQFIDSCQTHLSHGDLTLLIDGELPPLKRREAEKHLQVCRRCSALREQLENTTRLVSAYLNQRAAAGGQRSTERRKHLALQIERIVRNSAPNPMKSWRAIRSPRIAFPNMNPTLATAMVLALASVVCVFVWLHQARPSITSNALLVRAEAWDSAAAMGAPEGVIRQTIRIRTRKQMLQRAIYRDALGRRRPRLRKLAFEEEQLKNKLVAANVAWDAPLSATAYQDWHDRQRVRQDRITRSGRHLLVLTTTTPYGDVAAQSLTVRDTDFHPVERTVAFRDNETVEIAELDYRVLSWAAVSADEFEPIGALRSDISNDFRPAVVTRTPIVLTGVQLDEAEIGARFVLNQLHADTGEQIQIDRNGHGVEVKGLVETEQRKEELLGQLRMVPNLKTSILSIEELKQSPNSETAATSVKVASVSAQPSPLETYFVARGRDANALRSLSQQLLGSALTVSQESRALSDLQERFASGEGMTYLAKATLFELLFSHREKLLLALQKEQDLLGQAVRIPGGDQSSEVSQPGSISLVSAAERNLTNCEELTLGSGSQPRSAEAIIPELAAAINELRVSLYQAQAGSQSIAVQNGKK